MMINPWMEWATQLSVEPRVFCQIEASEASASREIPKQIALKVTTYPLVN